MLTPTQFTDAFPVFKDSDATLVAAAIGAATPFFNDPDRYGDFLAAAQGNLVAHFVLISQPEGNSPKAGANDAIGEDRPTVKITRAAALLERQYVEPFESTSYGRMFLYYQRLAGIGGAAAAGCDATIPIGLLGDEAWSG